MEIMHSGRDTLFLIMQKMVSHTSFSKVYPDTYLQKLKTSAILKPLPPQHRQTSAMGTPPPPPLRHADVLNGWSLRINIQLFINIFARHESCFDCGILQWQVINLYGITDILQFGSFISHTLQCQTGKLRVQAFCNLNRIFLVSG